MYKELRIKSKIRSYPVKFVDDYTDYLKEDVAENPFVIVDKNVLEKHSEKLLAILPTGNTIVIEAVEKNKSFEKLNPIIKTLLECNIRRSDKLIAIGGGITQDITAFVASILFRGIDWVLYPTTLLAQADSCIGSKTSINFGGYKNQIGTWYPPSKIILDTQFLKTLTQNDMLSGMGEIIKVHLLNGEDGLENIEDLINSGFRDEQLLNILIGRSLSIKKRFIEKDEFDRGMRNLLNYGHTFGHAVEALSNNKIQHGVAVGMGVCMANFISYKIDLITERDYLRMALMFDKAYKQLTFTEKDKQSFVNALLKDKKNTGGSIVAILTEGFGKMRKMEVSPYMLESLMNEMVTRGKVW